MDFQAHGDSDLWRKGDILFARLSGAWNRQAAEEFEQHFHTQALPLTKGQWAHVAYLQDWELCSADIFPIIERLVDWCVANGLVRAAQVYPKSTIKQQFIDMMVVERKGSFERRIFEHENDALTWLKKEGFNSGVSG